jgi:hypothetical protein
MVDSAFHVVDLHPATVTFTLHGTRSPQSVSHSPCESGLVRDFTVSILSRPMCFTYRNPLSALSYPPSSVHSPSSYSYCSPVLSNASDTHAALALYTNAWTVLIACHSDRVPGV